LDDLTFRVLGPVGVWRNDCQLRQLNAQQRTLLGMFLLDPGAVITFDQLVTALWGEQPPVSARNAVQGHVSKVRRMLSAVPEAALHTVGQGYRLEIERQLVDMHRFRLLVGRARTDPAAEAGELLRSALSLWRGPAFADVAGDWLSATAGESLEQERLHAVEDLAEADLGAGRHAEVAAQLSEFVGRHPLRERAIRLLMEALHRDGRRSDALELFRDTRRRLAEDLGVEPGEALQCAHRQILTADGPAPARPDQRSATVGVLRQLPADVPYFTGRWRQLAVLNELLPPRAETAPVLIGGAAGVGKTALTLHWAHQVADRFPDGQIFLNLRGFDPTGTVMAPAEALSRLLAALEVPARLVPAALDAQADLFRSTIAGKRILLVLDNARDTAQVRPLLPGTPDCFVVVNSRDQMAGLVAGHGAIPLVLDRPSAADARTFLANRLGTQRIAGEQASADEIVEYCGRLPLALAVVAARAVTHPGFPLAALAAELREGRNDLDAFANGDPATDLRTVFSCSYQALGPDAARLFRLLGQHLGPDLSLSAATSLAGQPIGRVRTLIAELTRARLIDECSPGRYAFHDLLRTYARELAQEADSVDERRAAMDRLLDHYLHGARQADLQLETVRDPIQLAAAAAGVHLAMPADPPQALAWLAAERAALLAAIDHAAAEGLVVHAWQLAWAIKPWLSRQGYRHDQLAAQRTAVAATARCGDLSARATAHRYLADAYDRLGRYAEADAQYQQALDFVSALGDVVGQGYIHLDLARHFDLMRRHDAALEKAKIALNLFRDAGHIRGQARSFGGLGWEYAQLGDYHEALAHCQQALRLLQQCGDRHGEASSWDSVGYIHHRLGDYPQAIECFQHSVEMMRSFGDQTAVAGTLICLGESYLASEDLEETRRAWRAASEILDELDQARADALRERLHRLPVTF
jgi:DNA-binding SARP family transcriptional activator/tetratricopeptide (TPR) repeat protein